MPDIVGMTKTATMKRERKTGRLVTAGRATDGVEILVPAARPKNFTFRQIEKTVEKVKGKHGLQRAGTSDRLTVPSPRQR